LHLAGRKYVSNALALHDASSVLLRSQGKGWLWMGCGGGEINLVLVHFSEVPRSIPKQCVQPENATQVQDFMLNSKIFDMFFTDIFLQ
jgi:hypothetical protein